MQMANLNVGFNFEIESYLKILSLNAAGHKNKVTSVYCSDNEHSEYSARPLYRFPEGADMERLLDANEAFLVNDITMWYTSNAITVGKKADFDIDKFRKLANTLWEAGIGMIIADTFLLEVLSSFKYQPRVELSTIMRIESPRQLIALKQQYPFITKCVMHISYNRSFMLLKQFIAAGKHCGIDIEVLTNELCGTGYETPKSGGASACIHRDSCYNCHAVNKTLEDAKAYKGYPFNRCIGNRYGGDISWLMLQWILPEDMQVYEDIGVTSFKVTGRTATSDFLDTVLTKYVKGRFDGNLLHLWKSISSINRDKEELDNSSSIDTEKLNGFIKIFAEEEIECHSRLCGIDCNYCEEFYNANFL